MVLELVKEYLKSYDLFAIPVQLTYRGQTAFSSVFGGCMSLFMIAGLIIYFILLGFEK